MAKRNRPSASNPRGLSDAEIGSESIAVTAVIHVKNSSTQADDEQFLAWISSDHNIRQAVISYSALSHWDVPMVEALEKAQRICRAKEGQLAAQLALDEIMGATLPSTESLPRKN